MKLRALVGALAVAACICASAHADDGNGRKREVGFTISQTYLPGQIGGNQFRPALGVIAAYRLTRHLALDGTVNWSPQYSDVLTNFAGGRMTQGLFGIRGGLMKGSFGFYGKVRPGFVSVSSAMTGIVMEPFPQAQTARLTAPAFDIGGILTADVTRRFVLRYELGSIIVHYRPQRFSRPDSTSVYTQPMTTKDLSFAFGFVVRF